MRKLFGLALLTLPLLGGAARAASTDFGTTLQVPAWRVDLGGKLWFKAYCPTGCNGYGVPKPLFGGGAPYAGYGGGGPGYSYNYGGPGLGGGAGGPQLGPWYNYWPLEAHFQTPAVPQYPYWPAPQVLPGQAAAYGPGNFHAPVVPASYTPSYWYGR